MAINANLNAGEDSLSRSSKFQMVEMAKFACVGVLNTAVDLVVLNALLFTFHTGSDSQLYTLFKAISFLIAVSGSYQLNKHFVFLHKERIRLREPALFFVVSIIGFAFNVGVASFFFYLFTSHHVLSSAWAANAGALAGSAIVLVWNYLGYKLLVFKQSYE